MRGLMRVLMMNAFAFCFTLSAMESGEVSQTSLLCTVPKEIVLTICEHLGRWRDINAFGATCKYLDRTVTFLQKEIRINCLKKRRTDQTSAHFLDVVDHLMSRIAARQGNNQIVLSLSSNGLADDMHALKQFFIKCSHQDKVDYIWALELACNGLEALPDELAGLSKLRFLSLESNQLQSDVMNRIVNLSDLEHLVLYDNALTSLPAHMSGMRKLSHLDVSANNLSNESLAVLGSIPNLKELKVSYNGLMTLRAVVRAIIEWKKIREVYANRISAAIEDVALLSTLPEHIKIYC